MHHDMPGPGPELLLEHRLARFCGPVPSQEFGALQARRLRGGDRRAHRILRLLVLGNIVVAILSALADVPLPLLWIAAVD
eukprot:1741893-Pyramimonas_sp.AAC.1